MTESQEKRTSTVREYVDSLLVTVILALFGTTFIVQAFKIPSSSMEKTLLVGDHLLVNKFVFADVSDSAPFFLPYRTIRRGDIIVFKYPYPPYPHFVKRVVGMPGDHLKIVARRVFINGKPLDEPYTIHQRPPLPGSFQDNFPPPPEAYAYSPMEGDWEETLARSTEGDELVLPPGKYFAMGDNRDNSQDSRYWGFVDRSNIIGRPLLIYWSFNAAAERSGFVGHTGPPAAWDNFAHFFSRTRWDRIFHLVR